MNLQYVISFDIETTGLSWYQDQVTEFGAEIVLWDSGAHSQTAIGTFARYVRPTSRTITAGAAQVTGITAAMVADKPNVMTVLREFVTYLDDVCKESTCPRILVSYNGFQYDIPMLVAELERAHAGSALPYFRQLKIGRTVDVLPLGRGALDTICLKRRKNGSYSYRLGDVYESLCHCALDGAHGALADSHAVLQLLACTELSSAFEVALTQRDLDPRSTRNIMQVVQETLKNMQTAKLSTTASDAGKKRFRAITSVLVGRRVVVSRTEPSVQSPG
jgi:DNA polymerase III alpha subunit (gram-positive type)